MGTTETFICLDCSNDSKNSNSGILFKLRYGIGMLFSISNLIRGDIQKQPLIYSLVAEEEIKKEVEVILKENVKVELNEKYGYEIFYCKACNSLESRFEFTIQYDDKKYNPIYKCKKCKSILQKVTIETDEQKVKIVNENIIKTYRCPRCGKENIAVLGLEMWD